MVSVKMEFLFLHVGIWLYHAEEEEEEGGKKQKIYSGGTVAKKRREKANDLYSFSLF